MKRILTLFVLFFCVGCAVSGAASEAQFTPYIGTESFVCTTNNLRIRQEPIDGEILGHLEQADRFVAYAFMDGWALIQVTHAAPTSPDSWIGLSGWVSMDYLKLRPDAQPASGMSGGWRQRYLEYIGREEVKNESVNATYGLIYVDADDIPELVIDTNVEAGGCLILTCHEGIVDAIWTRRLYFTYLERENLLSNSAGHQDYYYDDVYTIRDGKWQMIASGEYDGYLDGWSEEIGRWICRNYSWNGVETTMEEYLTQFHAIYDEARAIEPSNNLSFAELMMILGGQ